MIFRAWYAIPERLTTKTGKDTRGAYGFLTTFLRVIREHSPSHVVVTFDTKAPTFRNKLFPDYKAHRPPVEPELHEQIPIVKNIMGAFNVPIYEFDGYEADDLVGTLSHQANNDYNMNSIILTGDADQLQLVNKNIKVLMYTGFTSKIYNVDDVIDRYDGLGPEYVAEIKALEGDPSDNIPGVPGIGKKTARLLLNKFGHFESLFNKTNEISEIRSLRGKDRIRGIIENNKSVAYEGLKLTTIIQNVPISLDEKKSEFGLYDQQELIELLNELEFKSLTNQILNSNKILAGVKNKPANALDEQQNSVSELNEINFEDNLKNKSYKTITDKDAFIAMVNEIEQDGEFSFDTETSGLNMISSSLVGISFSSTKNKAWYIPLGHKEGPQINIIEILGILDHLFTNNKLVSCAHNANFDLTILKMAGIQVTNLKFDTMIAAFLCGIRPVGLKSLVKQFFNVFMTPIEDLIGKGKNQISMVDVPLEKASPYACADADFTLQLKKKFSDLLKLHNSKFTHDEIEIPLIPVIVEMQTNGMFLDAEVLNKMSYTLGKEISNKETDLKSIIKEPEINLNSNQQIASILIEKFGIPKTRKTKTGYSMDASSLENLINTKGLHSDVYKISERLIKYRELTKLKSTYIDSLPKQINLKTGKIHSNFNQIGSSTGRLSSNNPNIQNIPIRTDLGREVRKSFTSNYKKGWQLLAADYSQIELRILADLSEEKSLIESFNNNEDIHSSTAKIMYEVEKVSLEQRRIAKILNFGVIYGLGPLGISRQTNLSKDQGKKFIDIYFGKYSGIRKYIDEQKLKVSQNGYAETLTGRRRYLPDINSPNQRIKAGAERIAINMPIQGTAADLIKIAMINIYQELKIQKMSSILIAQVHDELIFEIAPGELMEMQSIVVTLMKSAMNLKIPLEVEIKTGPTWGDME